MDCCARRPAVDRQLVTLRFARILILLNSGEFVSSNAGTPRTGVCNMLTACHLRRIFAGACFGAAVLMPAFLASAQPLSVDVGPSAVGRAEHTARGWLITPAQDLYGRGPS